MRIGPEGRLFHLACIRVVLEGRLFFADAQHVVEIVGGKRPLQKPTILEVSDVGKDAARLAEPGPDMATARRRTGLVLPGERRGLGAALRAFGAEGGPYPCQRRLSRSGGFGTGHRIARRRTGAVFAVSAKYEAHGFIELRPRAARRWSVRQGISGGLVAAVAPETFDQAAWVPRRHGSAAMTAAQKLGGG